MNSKLTQEERVHFGELLVAMEHTMGTRDTCRAFLKCLVEALENTRFKNSEDAVRQIMGFYEMFANVRPRMAIIQFYLDRLAELIAQSTSDKLPALIPALQQEIGKAEKDNVQRSAQLTQKALRLFQNGNRILIHSHSHTVLDTLLKAKEGHKKFDVIVAEQEAGRTLEMVKFLDAHEMPFTVVPEYMLSHIESDISFMLIGAVTLKHDHNFAVDAGTKAIVSEMNSAHIPVYLMLTTNKFSYWKTKQAHQVVRTVKNVQHKDGLSYERIKFSHDRLPLSQVNRIITEEGVFSSEDLKKVYQQKLHEYNQKQEKLESALP